MRVLAIAVCVSLCVIGVYSIPKCPFGGKWTHFYDRDNPSATGDWELLKDLRKKHKEICERPLAIDVRLVKPKGKYDWWYLGGNYIADEDRTPMGFVCKNKNQKKYHKPPCVDYKVRFCCLPEPKCKGYWSPFYDRDNPSATGDWETLKDLRKKHPALCSEPSNVDARLTNGYHYLLGNDILEIKPSLGLVCKNKAQPDHECGDYEVRFCCSYPEPKCHGQWTQWFDRDNPSATGDHETLHDIIQEIRESKGGSKYYICNKPSAIDARALNPHRPWQAAFEKVHVSAHTGLRCINKDQSDKRCEDYKVRFCCPPPPHKCPYGFCY